MHVEVPDVDAVYARVVADGRAQVGREPHDEAYGARSFDMIDPYGHRWMIQTPIATPTVDEIQAGMEGFTITAAPAGTRRAGAGRDRLRHVRLAGHRTSPPRFYGALFGWETETGGERRRVRPRRQHQAADGPRRPGPATSRRCSTSGSTTSPRYAARVRELGGEVVSETTYDSGPNAVCQDDQGREFQLWQPAPGYE